MGQFESEARMQFVKLGEQIRDLVRSVNEHHDLVVSLKSERDWLREQMRNMDQRLTQLESNEELRFNPVNGKFKSLVARVAKLEQEDVPEVDRWLPRPDGATGTQFRCRKTYKNPGRPAYRLGGQQFYEIVAETAEWIVWRAWNSDGSEHYEENADKRSEFEAEYERRPGL